MRLLLSLAGLLVVLAIVMVLAKQSTRALAPAAPSASANGATAGSPAQQVERAQQDIQRALEQGAANRASAPEQ